MGYLILTAIALFALFALYIFCICYILNVAYENKSAKVFALAYIVLYIFFMGKNFGAFVERKENNVLLHKSNTFIFQDVNFRRKDGITKIE